MPNQFLAWKQHYQNIIEVVDQSLELLLSCSLKVSDKHTNPESIIVWLIKHSARQQQFIIQVPSPSLTSSPLKLVVLLFLSVWFPPPKTFHDLSNTRNLSTSKKITSVKHAMFVTGYAAKRWMSDWEDASCFDCWDNQIQDGQRHPILFINVVKGEVQWWSLYEENKGC